MNIGDYFNASEFQDIQQILREQIFSASRNFSETQEILATTEKEKAIKIIKKKEKELKDYANYTEYKRIKLSDALRKLNKD